MGGRAATVSTGRGGDGGRERMLTGVLGLHPTAWGRPQGPALHLVQHRLLPSPSHPGFSRMGILTPALTPHQLPSWGSRGPRRPHGSPPPCVRSCSPSVSRPEPVSPLRPSRQMPSPARICHCITFPEPPACAGSTQGHRMYPEPISVPLPSRGPASLLGVYVNNSTRTTQPPQTASESSPTGPSLLGGLTHPSPNHGFQRVGPGPPGCQSDLEEVAGRAQAGERHPGGRGSDNGCRSHPWARIRQGQRGPPLPSHLGAPPLAQGLGAAQESPKQPAFRPLCCSGPSHPSSA